MALRKHLQGKPVWQNQASYSLTYNLSDRVVNIYERIDMIGKTNNNHKHAITKIAKNELTLTIQWLKGHLWPRIEFRYSRLSGVIG
jgi:hypothetical protein